MPPAQRFRLKLSKLDFISAVDTPAQETATALLIKRGTKDDIALTAKVVKLAPELGLVFGWAFTSQVDGAAYTDLQGDQIDEDFVKAAMDFMLDGGASDEMHDSVETGRVVFAMPLTAEIAKAFGVLTDTTGLMVAIKPSASALLKFKSGEYSGFSIAGAGERVAIDKQKKCADCWGYVGVDDATCPSCGAAMTKRNTRKAVWSTAMVDDLPDSSFLYIETGGTKDSAGKTTPRSLRHFPYRDENGKIDIDHLRDAIGRIPQSSLPATLRNKLQVKAEKLLAAQHAKRVTKRALLTTADAGHVHLLDDGGDNNNPALRANSGDTDCRPMPGDASGGWHSHPWLRADDGTIVIGEAENHVHQVQSPEAINEIVAAGEADDDEDDASAGKRARKSTPLHAARSVTSASPEIAKMTTIAKLLPLFLAMSETQRTHVAKMAPDELESFFGKPAAERESIAKAAADADAPIFKGELTGVEVRKSDGSLALQLAKQNEENAKQGKLHAIELTKARERAEQVELEKRASADLSHFAKTVTIRAAILKAVDGIVDEATRKEAHEALKGANEAVKQLGVATGTDAANTIPTDKAGAYEALQKGLTEFAKEKGITKSIWSEGLDAFIQTPVGKALHTAYEAAKAKAN
jgi:hypothetical protein